VSNIVECMKIIDELAVVEVERGRMESHKDHLVQSVTRDMGRIGTAGRLQNLKANHTYRSPESRKHWFRFWNRTVRKLEI